MGTTRNILDAKPSKPHLQPHMYNFIKTSLTYNGLLAYKYARREVFSTTNQIQKITDVGHEDETLNTIDSWHGFFIGEPLTALRASHDLSLYMGRTV